MDQDRTVTEAAPTADPPRLLDGILVVARVRRLLLVAVVAGFVYSALLTASQGRCFEDGRCTQLTLQPSPLVVVAIAVLVLVALKRVQTVAGSTEDAVRMLDRTAGVVGILVAVAIVVSHVWFWSIDLGDGTTGLSVFSPFPFGGIGVTTTR